MKNSTSLVGIITLAVTVIISFDHLFFVAGASHLNDEVKVTDDHVTNKEDSRQTYNYNNFGDVINNDNHRSLRQRLSYSDPKTVSLKYPTDSSSFIGHAQLYTKEMLSGTHYRIAEWNARQGLYTIDIVQPKDNCVYSVTIESPNKYTGVAQLQSRESSLVIFSWSPPFPLDDYRIIVHELGPNYGRSGKKTVIVPPGVLPIPVQGEQLNEQQVSQLLKFWNEAPPCSTLQDKSDALSTWNGHWIGPDLERYLNWSVSGRNWLRNGWRFMPSSYEMNCQIETFTTEDLLSIPPDPRDKRKKSIFVIGTSIMRGVFLSLVDLLLPIDDKMEFTRSSVANCWGRAQLTKGNLRLTYQDFRVSELEEPSEINTNVNHIECHNGKIAKEDSKFLLNAYEIWEEIFDNPTQWPDVIFMLSGYGYGYDSFDFNSHTLHFARNLPKDWTGTLIFTDGQFSAAVVESQVGQFNYYRSDIRSMLAKIKDSRVRWLDSAGVSKEMKMYTERGPEIVAGTGHFHRSCNGPKSDPIKICSNITEIVAQMLLGHALGPKKTFKMRSLIYNRMRLAICNRWKFVLPVHKVSQK